MEKLLLEDDRPISVVHYIAELLDEAGSYTMEIATLSTCAHGSETLLDRMKWSVAVCEQNRVRDMVQNTQLQSFLEEILQLCHVFKSTLEHIPSYSLPQDMKCSHVITFYDETISFK